MKVAKKKKKKTSFSVQAKACIHGYEVGRSFNPIPEGRRKKGDDEEEEEMQKLKM
jgi:hypothetical protein